MIAVKGMEMPKSCALCERFEGACKYTDFGDYQTKRNPSCPLVEIVTCKDCRYWHDDGITTICLQSSHPSALCYTFDKSIGHGFPKDHFCADGERRE
jgi:hypothetical protein